MSRSAVSSSMSLGPLTILWGLLCGLATGGLMTIGEPTLMRVGMSIAACALLFAIAYFFGWVAWSANGRREGGGRVIFAVVALCLASACALYFKFQTSTIGVITAMQGALNAEAMEMQREAQNPALRPAHVDAIVERLAGNLEAATSELAKGPSKDLVLALRGIRSIIARNELAYAAAVYAFIEAEVLDFSGLNTVEKVRERGRLCTAFAQQNDGYLAYLDTTAQTFEKSISDIKMDDSTRKSVSEGFGRTLTTARAKVAATVEARSRFAAEIARLYRHLEASDGRWEVGTDGKVMFQLDADLDEFNRLAKDVDSAQAKLIELESGATGLDAPANKAATRIHGAG